MTQSTIFRFLVVASLLFAIFGSLMDHLAPALLPTTLSNAYNVHLSAEDPSLPIIIGMLAFAILLFVAALLATVGLLLFKWWGRPLSVWISVLSLLSYPFLGAMLFSGWALMFTEVATMMWGAVLAMAYYSDVRLRFESDAGSLVHGTRKP